MSGQIGPKDPKPAGITIYYNNNTKLELTGAAQGLNNKWKNADKDNIVVMQVFQNGIYQTIRKEKGEPGPALHIYNYSEKHAGKNFYWYDDNDKFYKSGNTLPGGIDPDQVGTGVTTSDEYFLAVYNISMEPSTKPTGGGGLSPIDPGLPPP